MIIVKKLDDNYSSLTLECEDGEEFPEVGEVLFFEGADDDGIRVGKIIYDKYGVRTYVILEHDIEGSYYDEDEDDDI